MPVNFGFSSENAKALLLKLDIPKGVIDTVEAFGWKLKLTDAEISLSKDGTVQSVPVSLSTLQALSAGKLLPKDYAPLASAVSTMMANVCTSTPGSPSKRRPSTSCRRWRLGRTAA